MKPRSNIEQLKAYQVLDESYPIKLDANESRNFLFQEEIIKDLSSLNLYPDDQAKALRTAIATYQDTSIEYVAVGNGSSELLDLLVKTYINPKDVILSFEPSFSMYKIYAALYDATYIEVSSEKDFSLSIDRMIEAVLIYQPKMIFICSPNNPTGYLIPKSEIVRLITSTSALVAVDEAYMEFSSIDNSLIDATKQYENLVVFRTFSKAFGLAGIRLGYMIANPNIVKNVLKVKAPYALNTLTQSIGIKALEKIEQVKTFTDEIVSSRKKVAQDLAALGFTVYPSEGNFLCVQSNINDLYLKLKQKGILIRQFGTNPIQFYRITIGTDKENQQLIQSIKEIIDENSAYPKKNQGN